jgi:lysozyme family protein
MRHFDDYFEVILEHEGGFVNHPSDPGGATNYGVSYRFLKGINLEDADIDRDGDLDIDDILALTVEDSKAIYKKYFWDPLHLEGIENEMLRLHIFDHGVNAGLKTAVKLLQRILQLDDDGYIGNMTTEATNSYNGDIIEEYMNARKGYYLNIIEMNPKLATFKRGWFNRVENTNFKT